MYKFDHNYYFSFQLFTIIYIAYCFCLLTTASYRFNLILISKLWTRCWLFVCTNIQKLNLNLSIKSKGRKKRFFDIKSVGDWFVDEGLCIRRVVKYGNKKVCRIIFYFVKIDSQIFVISLEKVRVNFFVLFHRPFIWQ